MTGQREHLWVAVYALPVLFRDGPLGDPPPVAALAVGLLVGVVWQVLARKEVGRRLTVLAVLGLAGGLFWAVTPLTPGEPMSGMAVGLYCLGVACAVVLTEQVLRRRDLGPVTRDTVHAPEEDAPPRRPA